MSEVEIPAFPQERTLPDGSHEECEGMSLRDYFAIKVLQGMMASPHTDPSLAYERYAQTSYHIADVMIKARQG